MTSEEIRMRAVKYTDSLNIENDTALTLTQLGFEHGAECMQEQCHKDFLEASAEIERQHVQDIRQKQAEIDELSIKVSELTEALDASHVFCEGVKEAMIDRACDAFCKTHCPNLMSLPHATPCGCGGRIHDDCDDLHKFIRLLKGE